jgi:acidic leucine-rich nuclear phosphoprotein 32 family protein A/C/D
MEKRISLECRGKEPAQVHELNLDNCRTVGEFEGLTDEFVNLTRLSVISAGLTSFKGFPGKSLQNLEKLDVSENRISSGLHHIQECPSLTHLCLSGNKFKDVSALEPLAKLEKLSHIELLNTPISEQEKYRSKVFTTLPQLQFVDGQDKDGNEAPSSDDDDEEEEDGDGEATENPGTDGQEETAAEQPVNGNTSKEEIDFLDEEVEEEEEDSEDESGEDEGPGLAALYNNANLEDSEDDEDFNEDGVEPEDDDDLDDSEDETNDQELRGKKRKHEAEEETG